MIPGMAEAHHNKREAAPQTKLISIIGCIALSVTLWDCIVNEFLSHSAEIVNLVLTNHEKTCVKLFCLKKFYSLGLSPALIVKNLRSDSGLIVLEKKLVLPSANKTQNTPPAWLPGALIQVSGFGINESGFVHSTA